MVCNNKTRIKTGVCLGALLLLLLMPIARSYSQMTAIEEKLLNQGEWKNNIDIFAQMYFGAEYSVPKDKFVKKQHLTEQIVGQRVRWPMKFQADIISRISEDKTHSAILGHNMALQSPFGPGDTWTTMKGIVWVMSASCHENGRKVDWTEMMCGIPPGSKIIVDMKITSVIAVRLGKDLLCIWPDGEDVKIGYSGPRCDWPEYTEKIKSGGLPSPWMSGRSAPLMVEVKNTNPWEVKVGLRQGPKGIDFIAPPLETGFAKVAEGNYDIYFQHKIEPEGLYKGDSFTIKDKSIRITLTKQVGGNYNVRKVK